MTLSPPPPPSRPFQAQGSPQPAVAPEEPEWESAPEANVAPPAGAPLLGMQPAPAAEYAPAAQPVHAPARDRHVEPPQHVIVQEPVIVRDDIPEDDDLPRLPFEVQAAAQALLDYISDNECSEVLLNGPGECSRKVRGVRYHCPEITFPDAATYHRVLNEVVLRYCDTNDRIDGHTVLIEGQMELPSGPGVAPMLARVHMIAPPGVQYAKVTIAKKPRIDLTLDDLAGGGMLTIDMSEFLKAIARGRATFVVSGPTGSGKTTFLQAMGHYFDANERIVVIEETPELRFPLGDVVYLRATLERPGLKTDEIFDLEFWTKQANRMRMDRVIVGETRGAEMAEFLVSANSGAEGSATTLHADSPRRALDKILALASRHTRAPSEEQLRREISATVDIIVQVGVIEGRHVVTGIEEVTSTVTAQTGQIQTNQLFTFDRTRGVHLAKGRPTDDLISRLAGRGVPLNPAWFRSR